LAALLAEIRPVYDEIGRLRVHWEELQTVERATAEYSKLLAGELRALAELQRRKQQLDAYRDQFRLLDDADDDDLPFPTAGPPVAQHPARRGLVLRERPTGHERARPDQAGLAQRRRLKQLVNRWAPSWGMDRDVLAEINRITEDSDRLLGEAIALLDWRVFEDPGLTRGAQDAHLSRLGVWAERLAEYRDQLVTEIDDLELRYQAMRPMWRIWRARAASEEGRRRWERLIDEARRSQQTEIRRLDADVAALDLEIQGLEAERTAGGQQVIGEQP
jgi:hypothetical protein